MSVLVSEYTGSKNRIPDFLKPPLLGGNYDSLSIKNNIDSVIVTNTKALKSHNNKKYRIGVVARIMGYSNEINLLEPYRNDFENLLGSLNELNGMELNLQQIEPTRGNTLLTITQDEIKNDSVLWKKYDDIFTCSGLVYNMEKNKAIAVISISSGSRDGYGVLVLLQKKKGNWLAIYDKTLTIS